MPGLKHGWPKLSSMICLAIETAYDSPNSPASTLCYRFALCWWKLVECEGRYCFQLLILNDIVPQTNRDLSVADYVRGWP